MYVAPDLKSACFVERKLGVPMLNDPKLLCFKMVFARRKQYFLVFMVVHFYCPESPFGTNRNVPNGLLGPSEPI